MRKVEWVARTRESGQYISLNCPYSCHNQNIGLIITEERQNNPQLKPGTTIARIEGNERKKIKKRKEKNREKEKDDTRNIS